MKKNDFIFISGIVLFFLPFFLSEDVLNAYINFNKSHGMVTSFFKFAFLATLGEVIGLRISQGVYNKKGFGIIPRAIVWGFLGLGIKLAFVVFATGMPNFLAYMGVKMPANVLKEAFSMTKLLTAFSISVTMNVIFAPVMMTFHKITDTHIVNNGGTITGLLRPINFRKIFPSLNWEVMWSFVFKKTIPFFWIPAHTITFMLPAEYQTLFAAVLGIFLGVFLALASLKKK